MEITAAMQQLNNQAVDYSYRLPLVLFGEGKARKGTFTAIKVAGDIYSFSVLKNGVRSVCTRSIELFERDLGISSSSVRRALKSEIIQELTKSEKKNAYEFIADTLPNGAHYLLEAWMTRPIIINGHEIVLTNGEQMVAAYLNSEARRQPLETSGQDIADVLGMSVPVVRRALSKLCNKEVKLVHRINKGKNGNRKSRYIINRELFRQLGRAEHKRRKAIEKQKNATDQESKAEEKTNFKAAIVDELSARKRYREECSERAYARALENKEFKMADEELKRLAPKFAFAEESGASVFFELQQRHRGLTEQRTAALVSLNMVEAELSEDFYIKCLKCRDKLFLSNGRVCECFARGSPPEEQ